MEEITSTELKQRLDKGDDIQIIDVREDNEVAIGRIPNSVHIPLAQVLTRMNEIDPAVETIVHCKAGVRSLKALSFLRQQGFKYLKSVKGGIGAWADEIDHNVPRY